MTVTEPQEEGWEKDIKRGETEQTEAMDRRNGQE